MIMQNSQHLDLAKKERLANVQATQHPVSRKAN